MRFTQIFLLPALTIGLVQGLALPETSTAVEAPGAKTELGSIVARAFTCPAKSSSQCTKCPKAPKKAKYPKCPKGKKGKKGCKRSEESQDAGEGEEEQEYNILEARANIDMDSIGWAEWKAEGILETRGLSVCSVMAVYDKTKFAMAHIPPARGANGQLSMTGAEVINEYKQKMTARSGVATMQQPHGYLLMSTYLGDEEKELLRKWFRDNNVRVTEKIYAPTDVAHGKGDLVLSRKNNAWPPKASLS